MAVFTTDVDLEADYGIDYTMGLSTIGEEFPIGTDAARVALAQAKYPYWIGWCLGVDPSGNPLNDRTPNAGSPAWSDAQILACSSFVAAWNDAVWSTGGAIGANWYIGALPLSRCNIIIPHGSFFVNYPLMLNFGGYKGKGSSQSAPDPYDYMEISGAGTTGVNGTYPEGADVNGRPSYSYVDTVPIIDETYTISWTGTAWRIYNDTTAALMYHSNDNEQFPYLCTTWVADTGAGLPTVTSGDITNILNQVTFGTRISVWHEEWLDIAGYDGGPIKQCTQSINWSYSVGSTLYTGVNGATGGSGSVVRDAFYMEGLNASGIRFEGRKKYAPESPDYGETYVTTYEDAGVAIWRMGSDSSLSDIVADNFNNAGFCLASGVPSNCYNLRSFDCNYAGMWLRGDGTFGVYGFECDECPTAFKATSYVNPASPASNLIPPGATLTVMNAKLETGTSGVASRYRGTMLFDGIGWCVVTFNGVGYASSNIYPELLCRIEPYPTGFTSTNSTLVLTGLKVFGFVRTLMHHSVSTGQSKKWLMPAGDLTLKYDSPVAGFAYSSANGGQFTYLNGAQITQKDVPYQNRQDWLTLPLGGADWDDTVDPGTPIYTTPAS